MVTVEYVVDGKNYKITESIKWKCELIKIDFLPIGQKCYAKMGATTVGSTAEISFNPNNPAEAFITKNVGKINVV